MTHLLSFAGGLVVLLIGGRLLVAASVDAARRLGVSPLVVGLTLVAWGTSAPEMALNLVSAVKGRGDLALGNVVGANICNIALVLGVCALVRPLAVQERLIRVEIWLNAAMLGFMTLLGLSGGFERWEAALMLGAFGTYSVWTILSALRETERREPGANSLGDDPTMPGPPMAWGGIAAWFVGGLGALGLGGWLASDGASGLAVLAGVPPSVVGVTVVSIGTTMPELVTGLTAVRRGQTDLALGNALGSCLFNAGAIFGLTGLISPPVIEPGFGVALGYMGVLAASLIVICRSYGRTVSRIEGAALLVSYAAFLALSAVRATAGREA